ncbi:MAG: hypothetical protein G01um101456_724 [Parcubacteria group bacterium Gr01-1014_56]|nr:MAG: hypothetical protein G01um101456_724 [Parcubacteria group bacterium Gr01-1014_56]
MKRILWVIVIVAVLGYGLFEARRIIGGPTVTIDAPINGSATSSTTVAISGSARNISFLTINDAPAFTDESGRFSERLSPPPGYAIFTVAATDRFGRRAIAHVHITILNFCPTYG